MKIMRKLFIIILLLLPLFGLSQVYQTVQSGDWDDPCTWSLNCDPNSVPPRDGTGNNFTIIISKDTNVNLSGSFYFKNKIELIVCGFLEVGDDFGQEYEGFTNLEGNALYLEVCCDATLIVHGTLTLKNVGLLNINGTFIVDGIYGHQANSGNCIYTSEPSCEGSISTPDGEIPEIFQFQLGEEDDCMTGISPILPIELLEFNVSNGVNHVVINWITASEINNNYFTIEKSKDLYNWEIVSKINGHGNSNYKIYYTSEDFYPYNGISYYRLKQTDFDGKFEYFNPVSIERNVNNILVYNSDNNINIIASDYIGYNINIYNMRGILVYSDIIHSDRQIINLSDNILVLSIYNNFENIVIPFMKK